MVFNAIFNNISVIYCKSNYHTITANDSPSSWKDDIYTSKE
jgi:hypothetical protein